MSIPNDNVEEQERELGRLVVFLYVVLRDHLPFGAINEIMRNHVGESVLSQFSDTLGAAMARKLAYEILGRPILPSEKSR